ncbi:Pimeloyl-ACP methyl ester carboxylesterase [Bosea lupini]|uniref:Pimeloyl-ACP methyl ester carboxylesterase n=1 Tax=Bosea lupini TaxID=1036779 RepID=A0A1H7GJM2_9HYPH|nr:Pimeloyl-ACP methyl ester carboxylesterase [Bosea lupini]
MAAMQITIPEPLVLIPGLNCTPALYAPQWPALAPGRQILVADNTTDDTIAAMVERLLATAPERFALCGLSMGGYVAFEVARRAPERVTRLALLDTTAKPPTPETNAPREQMIALAEKGAFDNVVTLLWQKLVAPDRLADDTLRLEVRAMAEAVGPSGFIRQQRAIMGRSDARPVLRTISVPTLVVVGAEDAITPPDEAREIAGGIGTKARYLEIPGCGHLSTLEAPEIVTAALRDWLA